MLLMCLRRQKKDVQKSGICEGGGVCNQQAFRVRYICEGIWPAWCGRSSPGGIVNWCIGSISDIISPLNISPLNSDRIETIGSGDSCNIGGLKWARVFGYVSPVMGHRNFNGCCPGSWGSNYSRLYCTYGDVNRARQEPGFQVLNISHLRRFSFKKFRVKIF